MGMSEQVTQSKELVLAPFTYAFMQDTTKGLVKIFTGPTVINQTAQEVPVVYDQEAGRFRRCTHLTEAVRHSPIAVEGYYLVLFNPCKDGQPETGQAGKPSPDLEVGRRVNIPGPWMHPLWPGQAAHYIRGHHIRSNQYLLVRIYNEEEARANWTKAIVKPAEETEEPVITDSVPDDLSVGKLFLIKGTEVSFYIPPTGVTVVKVPENQLSNASADDSQGFVREALTLERLEYCILRNQDGSKRYERGPQVVFPQPTEEFLTDKKGKQKSRAIELTGKIQGIHIKVTSAYKEEDGTEHNEGDELWITGEEVQIYYPREEHAVVTYDGKDKHYATTVPAGEGRYILNRQTGEITTVKGPAMLMPDPREFVIVRRVLSAKQCNLWYEGNKDVAEHNAQLRDVEKTAPTTRSGAVSEGDYGRSKGGRARKHALIASAAGESLMEKSLHGGGGGAVHGDQFVRSATYTQPRSITLYTKLEGAVTIDIWPGYAIMVVSKTGNRRVEVGPKTVILDYDESLAVLELSRGRPKTTDRKLKTVYLLVTNNKVSDLIDAETSDHVQVQLKLSFRCGFEGTDPNLWFSVENYIKFFTDHVRSVLKAAIKQTKIDDFYADSTAFIRDTILGAKPAEGDRRGMVFDEIGLRVVDVEVLNVEMDERIQHLLDNAQHSVVKGNIANEQARHTVALAEERHILEVRSNELQVATKKRVQELQVELGQSELATALAKIQAEIDKHEKAKVRIEASLANTNLEHGSKLERIQSEHEQRLEVAEREQAARMQMLQAETQAAIDRFGAVEGGFTEALTGLSADYTLTKMTEATAAQRLIGGENFVDAMKKLFGDQPLEGVTTRLAQLTSRASRPSNGSGKRKPAPKEDQPQT